MAKKKKEKMLKITQVKSIIGQRSDMKKTVEALGLRKMHQTVIKTDTPQIRGMVSKIRHLVLVEEEA